MSLADQLEVSAQDFVPVADALRDAIVDHYHQTGAPLEGAGGLRTLETNSGLAATRGNSLLRGLALSEPELDLHGLDVLDVGCGFGSLAVYFAFLGARVTAVDVVQSRLEVGERVARQFELRIHWIQGSVQELPLADRSYDVAVLNNSLCYVVSRPERLVGLVQLWRVLRPGGRLLMRNPNRTALRDPFTGLPGLNRLPPAAAAAVSRGLGTHRSNVRLQSARSQRAELRRVGYERIDIHSARPRTIKSIDRWAASYQHVLARRPAGP
jgi:2-polyprenyl-3-methyl-5-hydroxy-6-metoxy-1,4-benzoquinol methylase